MAAGDEDARGDDGVLVLALEEALLVDALKELLGRIRDALGKTDGVAHGLAVAVRVLKVPSTAALSFAHLGRGHLQCASCTRVAVLEGDDGRELLRGVEERVGRPTDSGRVVSLAVCERAPCGSGKGRKCKVFRS